MTLLGAWLLTACAAYSLAYNLVYEVGPWQVFVRIRYAIHRFAVGAGREWMLAGIECPKCVGFWCCWLIGLCWFALTPFGIGWLLYPVVALAAHGLLILIHWSVVVLMRLVEAEIL